MPSQPFGAILAGGRSTRYGAVKALATVHGHPIIERVAGALQSVLSDLVIITNDNAPYAHLGYPMRADRLANQGALGGLHSALVWAEEEQRPGALAVASDMPFLSRTLLQRLVSLAAARLDLDVIAPASDNRHGLEPLCACYSTRCLPAIEQAIGRGDTRMIAFHDQVTVLRLPREEVRRHGDPAVIFMNVNTPAEREHAEQLAQELDGES